jgi:purine-nucleoside phosphorylase
MLEKIKSTVDFLKAKTNQFQADFGIILGTGLGGLVNEIETAYTIPYTEIPNFPVSTVQGHSGNLIFGTLNGKKVIALQGRFHYYEGYSMEQVVFPVRVMKFLGIKTLLLSNASGGVNPDYEIGEIVILRDHINLFPNPLIGKNIDELGPRFPDMSEPYKKSYIQLAEAIAQKMQIRVKQGVYVGLTGPTFETPAEYKYIKIIGGDLVGMSTVPEVIAAKHMGLDCFCISICTDLGVEGKIIETTHEEVQHVARLQEPKMTAIIKTLVKEISN